jgi:hypothetical protein
VPVGRGGLVNSATNKPTPSLSQEGITALINPNRVVQEMGKQDKAIVFMGLSAIADVARAQIRTSPRQKSNSLGSRSLATHSMRMSEKEGAAKLAKMLSSILGW